MTVKTQFLIGRIFLLFLNNKVCIKSLGRGYLFHAHL